MFYYFNVVISIVVALFYGCIVVLVVINVFLDRNAVTFAYINAWFPFIQTKSLLAFFYKYHRGQSNIC